MMVVEALALLARITPFAGSVECDDGLILWSVNMVGKELRVGIAVQFLDGRVELVERSLSGGRQSPGAVPTAR